MRNSGSIYFKLPALLLVLLASLPALAGNADSSGKEPPAFIRYFHISATENDSLLYLSPDSALESFELYTPAAREFPHALLGGAGTAAQNLEFRLPPFMENYTGFSGYDLYRFSPGNSRFYKCNKPYTQINYALGPKKEQLLQVDYAQNFSPLWNISARFRKILSDGYYKRQNVNTGNIDISSWYHNKPGSYNLFCSFIVNKASVQENGGLASDSVFRTVSVEDPWIYPVKLAHAETRFGEKIFFIRQSWNRVMHPDSSTKDSSTQLSTQRLSYEFSYSEKTRVYEDTDAPLSFYFDSLKTLDSLHYSEVLNKLSWYYPGPKNIRPGASGRKKFVASVFEQHVRYRQRDTDILLHNAGVSTAFSSGLPSRWINWKIDGSYFLYGSRKGNMILSANNRCFIIPGTMSLYAEAGYRNSQPSLMLNKYHGNTFSWDNNYENTLGKWMSSTVSFDKISLSAAVRYITISNLVYFDVNSIPQQYRPSTGVFSASLSKSSRSGYWGMNNRVVFQFSETDIIRLPGLVSFHTVYFEKNIFKSALLLRAGIDVFQSVPYNGNAFNPVLSEFHLQDDQKTEGYFTADFFLSCKIKTARIFLKSEHLSQGLPADNWFMVPHYPLAGRSFKFGISWKFYD